jgi:hypothetical protein
MPPRDAVADDVIVDAFIAIGSCTADKGPEEEPQESEASPSLGVAAMSAGLA